MFWILLCLLEYSQKYSYKTHLFIENMIPWKQEASMIGDTYQQDKHSDTWLYSVHLITERERERESVRARERAIYKAMFTLMYCALH